MARWGTPGSSSNTWTRACAWNTRLIRSAMLEVLRQDYVRFARAKGLATRVVVLKHAFRNALIPTITIWGLQIGYLLGGAFVIENVFAWPGIGRLAVQSVFNRDYPLIQTIAHDAALIEGVDEDLDIRDIAADVLRHIAAVDLEDDRHLRFVTGGKGGGQGSHTDVSLRKIVQHDLGAE